MPQDNPLAKLGIAVAGSIIFAVSGAVGSFWVMRGEVSSANTKIRELDERTKRLEAKTEEFIGQATRVETKLDMMCGQLSEMNGRLGAHTNDKWTATQAAADRVAWTTRCDRMDADIVSLKQTCAMLAESHAATRGQPERITTLERELGDVKAFIRTIDRRARQFGADK